MKHRLTGKFRHIAPRRRYGVAVGAAGVLAAALTTGLLVSQSHTPATGHRSSAVAVADLARANDQVLRDPDQAGTGPAPATPAPAQPPAAPAQTTPAQPVKTTPAKPAPPASKVLDYEYQAQINGYYCGPAAARLALTARDKHPSQDDIAGRLGTTVNGTNSAEDTTRVLNDLGNTGFYHTTSIPGGAATPAEMDRLQADAVHAISNGYAIVANIVGSATDTDGGWHAYDGGHYLTVVGYRDNGRTVQIADPAYVNGVSSYWMSTINLANWMATRGYSA